MSNPKYRFFTEQQVAEMTGVSLRTVRRWVGFRRTGEPPAGAFHPHQRSRFPGLLGDAPHLSANGL
jgi:hypothetical protein